VEQREYCVRDFVLHCTGCRPPEVRADAGRRYVIFMNENHGCQPTTDRIATGYIGRTSKIGK